MNNAMPQEVTVIIKGDESTYRQKFLCYDPITIEHGSPILKDLVEQARESYKGEVEEIKIRIAAQWL